MKVEEEQERSFAIRASLPGVSNGCAHYQWQSSEEEEEEEGWDRERGDESALVSY